VEGVPWLIGGGAEHPPEVGRLLAYAAVQSNEGVVGITDLRVTAQAAPAASVQVAAGACTLLNRYPGGGQQSYIARAPIAEDLVVPGTGAAGGRTDLVVVRIDDPQYPGVAAPASVQDGPYVSTYLIQNVPAGTQTAAELNLGYPAIALARITQPANNASITNAMITDLREVANPRTARHIFAYNLGAGVTDVQNTSAAGGEQWPDSPGWVVDVPEWATQARIVATWAQVLVPAGNATGNLWARLGTAAGDHVDTPTTRYDTPGSTQASRSSFTVAATVAVPAGLRGDRSVPVELRAQRLTESGAAAEIRLDQSSATILDIEFGEQAAGV
jgi:hypothetical protein